MRPLALLEAPDDALKHARGVVFDVDDTVTRDGRLELDAFAAMWRAKRAGLKLVAVTGRPLGWTDVIARHWPVDLAIGENGAGWAWMESGRFRTDYFDNEEARNQQREQLARIQQSLATQLPEVRLAGDSDARRCDLAFDAYEEAHLSENTVAQTVDLIRSHGTTSFVSSVHIHAVPGSWDKARGCVRAMERVFGENLDQTQAAWWFVGDSGNDAAAFSYFDNSVGVANVADHLGRLPVLPRYVTRGDRGLGYAELLDALVSSKLG